MTTYAVDIDGTLCEEQNEWWKYRLATPILENIEAINRLYEEGENIVIYTARFEDDRQVTQQWLKDHGVKYHRLVMDKFRADVYVDSNMIKPEDIP
jgi:uncharacterized HAD superfamily protein